MATPDYPAVPAQGSLLTLGAADAILLASAARTTSQKVVFSPGVEHDCVEVLVDTTVFGTSSNTVTIEAWNPAAEKWEVLLTGAAIVSNAGFAYRVGPEITAVANLAAQRALAPIMRAVVTVGNANPSTYSVAVRAS